MPLVAEVETWLARGSFPDCELRAQRAWILVNYMESMVTGKGVGQSMPLA